MSSSGCLRKLPGISLHVAGLSDDFGLLKRELAVADVVEALERVDVGTWKAGALGRAHSAHSRSSSPTRTYCMTRAGRLSR